MLSISLFVAGCLSLVSLLILKASENLQPKHLQLGTTTTIFSFFLSYYLRIILSLNWDGKFAATFVIFPIILLLIFKALYLLIFSISRKSEENSITYTIYCALEKIKSNVFRLNELTMLFIIASIGILIMANLPVFWTSLSYIMR